jgi:type I restriction enzyme S subunit
MELIKGYKKTDLGILPEDWEIRKFKEITNTITCGVAATPIYVQEFDGMPFLSASHVQSGKVINDDYKFITKEFYSQITKNNKPEKGDILYTRVGAGIGQAGVIDFDLDFAIYVSLTLIKVKSSIDSNYIKFLLNSNYYQFLAKNTQFAGGGVQNLNVNIVREFPIPLPLKTEQKAISTALSDADALINNLEKVIEKKKNIKQGAMQQLLKPKKDWLVKKLGEICEIKKGQLITEATAISGDIPVIAGGKKPSYYHNKANRFNKTITISGSGANAGFVSYFETPIFASDCSTIEEDSAYSLKYIYYNLQFLQNRIYKAQTGGAQPHIHPSDLHPFEIAFPELSIQKSIATILTDIDNEIDLLGKKLIKQRLIKQGMMQNLLTGKIRLV